MKELLPYGELLLLIILTLLQAGRWTQKQETTPEQLAEKLRNLKEEVDKNYAELRKHKHEWNNHLQTVDYHNDQRYVRKDIYDVEKTAIDDRISELENWRNKTMGIV